MVSSIFHNGSLKVQSNPSQAVLVHCTYAQWLQEIFLTPLSILFYTSGIFGQNFYWEIRDWNKLCWVVFRRTAFDPKIHICPTYICVYWCFPWLCLAICSSCNVLISGNKKPCSDCRTINPIWIFEAFFQLFDLSAICDTTGTTFVVWTNHIDILHHAVRLWCKRFSGTPCVKLVESWHNFKQGNQK